ncbi:DEAD/DEAH box helicase [Marinilabilia rubra]|uniref:ATP-dependent RNA helicase n=1 Tax=Marinilabilia rubra TaxID=2162893 RepID=A0A2U2B694_9BACT|nr:DEAD/DEAH box helicase [Marinilabilia rubra]PWD98575.1 ATP-dependent RNA helicase [Marinilabilia rubra]
MKFTEFGFSQEVIEGLEAMRFEKATPVQVATIPPIMNGKDMIACAQTGTGKTAAYLLPVLDRQVQSNSEGLNTLVLVPTRELAMQIDQQMEGFGYFLPITSIAVYGGNDADLWNRQKTALTKGANVIIATPGRLIQHLSMGYVKMDSLKHLILDEADRMLDMGFYEDIMQIVSYLPKKRQTLMFSATMPKKIRDMARELLAEFEEVNIALSKPAEGILQGAYVVYENQKIPLVNSLLKGKDLKSIIVFSSTKQKVKDIHRSLRQNGFNSQAIHSDLDQKERTEVMREFRNRNIQILVATDIVARGIDVVGIDLVINFDVPNDAEDYVHRVGRTARAESTGVALTFISDRDQSDFQKIEDLIETKIIKIPPPPEVGEGPEYNPKQRNFKGKPRKNFKKKNRK